MKKKVKNSGLTPFDYIIIFLSISIYSLHLINSNYYNIDIKKLEFKSVDSSNELDASNNEESIFEIDTASLEENTNSNNLLSVPNNTENITETDTSISEIDTSLYNTMPVLDDNYSPVDYVNSSGDLTEDACILDVTHSDFDVTFNPDGQYSDVYFDLELASKEDGSAAIIYFTDVSVNNDESDSNLLYFASLDVNDPIKKIHLDLTGVKLLKVSTVSRSITKSPAPVYVSYDAESTINTFLNENYKSELDGNCDFSEDGDYLKLYIFNRLPTIATHTYAWDYSHCTDASEIESNLAPSYYPVAEYYFDSNGNHNYVYGVVSLPALYDSQVDLGAKYTTFKFSLLTNNKDDVIYVYLDDCNKPAYTLNLTAKQSYDFEIDVTGVHTLGISGGDSLGNYTYIYNAKLY